MRFKILRASFPFGSRSPIEGAVKGENDEWFLEIGTLEELVALNQAAGCDLIFDAPGHKIWIYDDYME